MIFYILLTLITYISIYKDQDIKIDIYDSFLLFNENKRKEYAMIVSLIFPITIIILIMNKKYKIIRNVVVLAFLLTVIQGFTSAYNNSVDVRSSFDQKINERSVILDKMKNVIFDKLHVSNVNDSSYYNVILAITENRKDGAELTWKWVQENNPNINFNEVSEMYKDISSNILSLRNELQGVEVQLQTISKEWFILHNKFPSNILLFYQNYELEYKPVKSYVEQSTRVFDK